MTLAGVSITAPRKVDSIYSVNGRRPRDAAIGGTNSTAHTGGAPAVGIVGTQSFDRQAKPISLFGQLFEPPLNPLTDLLNARHSY